MFKYILYSLFPSMLPTIILIALDSFMVQLETYNVFPAVILSLFHGIIGSLINPMTYIVALLLGFSAYKIKNIRKRLMIQILGFSGIVTLIFTIHFIINEELMNELITIMEIFAGMIMITLPICLINAGIEKQHLRSQDK